MPRKIDVALLKKTSERRIDQIIKRVQDAEKAKFDYLLVRWICQMSAVEIHAVWERYVEGRLVAALNHDASNFLTAQNIKGVTHVSYGLATYIVRGGNRYFDFRSIGDLVGKADRWLGKTKNVFRHINKSDQKYVDALASIRNCVVHDSDAALESYKYHLLQVYGIKASPEPDEFLNAKDNRAASPAPKERRLKGLAVVLKRCIQHT